MQNKVKRINLQLIWILIILNWIFYILNSHQQKRTIVRKDVYKG